MKVRLGWGHEQTTHTRSSQSNSAGHKSRPVTSCAIPLLLRQSGFNRTVGWGLAAFNQSAMDPRIRFKSSLRAQSAPRWSWSRLSKQINIYSANVTYLCIKLIKIFRQSLVDFLLEVGDEMVEFLDSHVAAFPTWQSCVKTKQTQFTMNNVLAFQLLNLLVV